MRVSSTYKKLLTILTVLFIAIIFLTTTSSCSLFNASTEIKEEAEKDPAIETEEPDEIDEDGGQAVMEEEEEDIAVKIWIEDLIPEEIASELFDLLVLDTRVEIVDFKEQAQAVLEILPAGAVPMGPDIYKDLEIFYIMAPVVSFYNISDETAWEDIIDWWAGNTTAFDGILDVDGPPQMIIGDIDYGILQKILGEPLNENIQVVPGDAVQDSLRIIEGAIAITSFENINKQFKVLSINEMSVFDRELDYDDYPLAFSVMLTGTDKEAVQNAAASFEGTRITNRDMSKFTSLMMTGVTAMVRGTANRMERYGNKYPGEKIVDILRDADITHISNEVPFKEGCEVAVDRFPYFCSKPSYIELLEYVGTDVIELTGNHMNDQGHEWFIYTLDMYDEKDWPYYGGGRDLEESYKPATLESNGNKFAFLGFNWWGPAYDWATKDSPGSAPPNFEDFEEIIKDLKSQGYIVIFTFQYLESYQYEPVGQQKIDFRRMADAGADIVSGSQSHQPQGVEISEDWFINYGLGNLFFDQMRELGTRQGLIAKHIFYEGRHINTVIITTMLEDYSQPRIATQEERTLILESIFAASIR
ncbi:MAG: CapA family protein [Actinobacteria bacterium]|nr:CapA family protein [Actinomycetota bacterium]